MVPLVRLLTGLHEDVRAYPFLFMEVEGLSSTAASCRDLCSCLWANAAFWRHYSGPCLSGLQPTTPAAVARDTFRKWLFHLEGAWPKDFKGFCDEAKQAEFGADFTQLLADARHIVSGLMPHDGFVSVEEFSEMLCALLTEYNPSQLDERSAAEQLVLQVERRDDVFTEAQAKCIAESYERSVEQAILDEHLDSGVNNDPILNMLEDDVRSEADSFPGNLDWEPPRLPPPLGDELEELLPGNSPRGHEEVSFWRAAEESEPTGYGLAVEAR